MASGRPKRHISVPKKFSIEEGYTLPDSPERNQQQRVLRYLNEDDVGRVLQDLTVYVLWPEDNLWYEALIQKTDQHAHNAKLFYMDTAEEEVVDLNELIGDKHIAFLETRPAGVELNEDELLADNLIHITTRSASEASDFGEGSSGHEGSSPFHGHPSSSQKDSTSRLHASRFDAMHMLMPGMRNESGRYGYEPMSLQGTGLMGYPQPDGSGLDRLNTALNGNPFKRRSDSLLRQSSTGSRESQVPLRLDIMTTLREKTVEQLKAVLKLGTADDSKEQPNDDEKQTEEQPDPEAETDPDKKPNPIDKLAETIEIEIMKHCGGENKDYKSKFRTLYFNLKDARNPELRHRVLKGEISPEQLVTMSPKELASQELIEWRQKKKEEQLQATVLDEDAAAAFSTAAALKRLESIREQRFKEDRTDTSPAVDPSKLPAVAEEQQAFEDMNLVEQEPFEEADSTSGDVHMEETLIKIDSFADGAPPSTVPVVEEEALDLEEIPEWAMEVVEAPPPPAQSTSAPLLYSPKAAEERNNSVFGPVPIRANPPDLTSLLMKDEGNLIVGETVWQGEIGLAEQSPFKAECISIAGKCDLKTVLSTPQVVVQGRMNLKKVEEFLEKLRSSKSRSVTIAILRPPTDATDEDIAAIQENVHYYLSRERTGAMTLGEGVEGYLIAKCSLTGRLLTAAQTLMDDIVKIPSDIDMNEFLLVVVHKKDWTSMPSRAETSLLTASASTPPEAMEAMISDPRIRAGIKPVVALERKETGDQQVQSLPTGLTLESISNLAALLGVQKQQAMPSAPTALPSVMPPHQMSVPGAAGTGNLSGIETQQQQTPHPHGNVVVQADRPKFLIFDPLTNKAVPLNPASLQYDAGTNRILMLSPLPQGFAVQQLSPSPTVDTSSAPEIFLSNVQGSSIRVKSAQGEAMTEEARLGESTGFMDTSVNPLQTSPVASSSRLTKPLVEPMIPSSSFQGRGAFRHGRSNTGGFNRTGTSSVQSFPESSHPL